MKKSKYNIHIGKLLEVYVKKYFVKKKELAHDIDRSTQSITKYLQNDSIQTSILIDICYALEYNFFQDMANNLPREFTKTQEINIEEQEMIQQLQEENKVLKIQNELLMKLKG